MLRNICKDIEAINAQLEKVAKEFNKNIQERSAKAEEEKREQELKKLQRRNQGYNI